MRNVLPLLLTLSLAASISPRAAAADQWAEGIPYGTDWDQAIEQARSTGKMLFIYSGWLEPGK